MGVASLAADQRKTQVTALKATKAQTTKVSHFIHASGDTPRPQESEDTAANEGRGRSMRGL
jgi:hypothetical protein